MQLAEQGSAVGASCSGMIYFPKSLPVRFRAAGQHEVVGGFAERDLVGAVRDAPLVRRAVEPREQARVGRQRHLARFAGREFDPLEAEQPHALFAGRVGEVSWGTSAPSRLPVLVTVKLAVTVSPPLTLRSL